MKAAIGLILFIVACAVLVSNLAVQAETFPSKSGTKTSFAEDGYPLTKCGYMTGATAQYDSVVAPMHYRIARLDISSTQGAVTEILYLAIKQAYHGTHLDSFPTDPSASRVATSNTSGTTVAVMPRVSTKIIQDYGYFMNTDKVYMHAASIDATWNLSWCAYLVSSTHEDRASDSTISVYDPQLDETAIPRFLGL